MIAALLLAAMLATSWYVRRRLVLDFGPGRARAYLVVTVRQIAGFALPGIGALALAGEARSLRTMPASFARLADTIGIAGWIVPDDTWTMLAGALGGSDIGAGFAFFQWRRRGRRGPLFGELGWLLPRDRADLRWGLVLSFVAGVVEELYFRLALPLLIALSTGSMVAGLAA